MPLNLFFKIILILKSKFRGPYLKPLLLTILKRSLFSTLIRSTSGRSLGTAGLLTFIYSFTFYLSLSHSNLEYMKPSALRNTALFQIYRNHFFFSFSGWGESESTWYVGHCWPIVPAPDDRWCLWSSWSNEDWQGKPKYSEKTCSSATLSTTNPT
jgi:hypothetical protein